MDNLWHSVRWVCVRHHATDCHQLTRVFGLCQQRLPYTVPTTSHHIQGPVQGTWLQCCSSSFLLSCPSKACVCHSKSKQATRLSEQARGGCNHLQWPLRVDAAQFLGSTPAIKHLCIPKATEPRVLDDKCMPPVLDRRKVSCLGFVGSLGVSCCVLLCTHHHIRVTRVHSFRYCSTSLSFVLWLRQRQENLFMILLLFDEEISHMTECC